MGNWAFGNQNVPLALANNAMANPYGYRYQDGLNSLSFPQMNGVGYNFQAGDAVTYTDSAGQNNTNPRANFEKHVVVRIGNLLYDPSYGVIYGANLVNPTDDQLLRAFEATAIAGYAKRWPVGMGGVTFIRPASVAGGLPVTLELYDNPSE